MRLRTFFGQIARWLSGIDLQGPPRRILSVSMLKFHALGGWKRGDVVVEWRDSTHRPTPEQGLEIDRAWRETLARPGVALFDGPMCRLESWSATPARLNLSMSLTGYKAFVGTNLTHPEWANDFGLGALANPVGVSSALRSADGMLLFGQRSDCVAYYPSRLHPFAGALEPRDDGDVFAGVMRELREELNLSAEEILTMHCAGLVEDLDLRQPELIFVVNTCAGRDELERRMDPAEHGALYAIAATCECIAEELSQNTNLTPVARAALLLYGREAFGAEWFVAHLPAGASADS